jgi:hypothetical protein
MLSERDLAGIGHSPFAFYEIQPPFQEDQIVIVANKIWPFLLGNQVVNVSETTA